MCRILKSICSWASLLSVNVLRLLLIDITHYFTFIYFTMQEGSMHATWTSFEIALEQYSNENHVLLSCVNSRTVMAANKLLTSE